MRARRFDDYARDFMDHHRDGVIVNLGCGFDTRFHRIDDGNLKLLDIDRTDVIRVKRQLLSDSTRYRFIEASVLDEDWMEGLPSTGTRVLFLAEGLFMYQPFEGVRSLVLRLQKRCPGSQLIAEVFNTRWLRPWIKWFINLKLRKQFCFGKDATFISGLRESTEMERWSDGIKFIDEWCALDEREPKLGVMRILRYLQIFRRVQWIVHYRLCRV